MNVADTIAQRDLRNYSGEILRRVESGESFDITTRGKPVARLVPFANGVAEHQRRMAKPALPRTEWVTVTPVTLGRTTAEILDELRGDT